MKEPHTPKKNSDQLETMIRTAFKLYDTKDRRGIGRDQVKRFFNEIFSQIGINNMSNEELDILINEVDVNGDDFITLEELLVVFLP